ncbi:MAG: 3-dehydroquinate synthase [Firmicutes bacterium]|nr:3-dehydroquinate synthase [Bacillota bacterium]
MFTIRVQTPSGRYPVFLGRGLLKNTGLLLAGQLPAGPVLVVSDKNVAPLYARQCLQSLQAAGYKPYLKVLAGGEQVKTLETAAGLYTRALQAGLDRRAAIVALGGGVVGDLAGFVAATYLRGVPYVQVPTTLLAMVDSSVGGKVAVNHPLGKNLIGSFYQPTLVVSDVAALKTLPAREFNAGLAELVKYALIWDRKFFIDLENLQQKNIPAGNSLLHAAQPRLLKYIRRAIRIKGEIVSRDERENDLRRILNFGHTFAHALEAATDYAYYLHGEAVACGMLLAVRLAELLRVLERNAARRIRTLLRRLLKFPPPPPALKPQAVAKALFYDKKKEGAALVFILPQAAGRVLVCKAPPFNIVQQVIDEYLY